MTERKSMFPRLWTEDSPLTLRIVLLLLMAGGAGWSVASVNFKHEEHARLPGHPVIVQEVRAEREKQREAITKLTKSVDALNLTMKLQGDGTWQRVHDATGAASAGP